MFVGIDIGGTFTDIAAIQGKKIIYQNKVPTTPKVLNCVLNALDSLLENIDHMTIKRLCISTTLITNAIIKNNLPATSLIIMPGPGFNCKDSFPVPAQTIKGYINHLGTITASPNLNEIDINTLADNIAISGKFSVRNPENEQKIAIYLQDKLPYCNIVSACSLSGKLNFIRRTNTAYYAAATKRLFSDFSQQVQQAVATRGLNVPLTILKADAGAIAIEQSMDNTAEFIFTGPAASVLGIKALIRPQDECIALDIGGTTTDISFWRLGEAILNNKGAKINGFNTSIHTFYLHSLGLGGNSLITINSNQICIGPEISTSCICLGGSHLTLTDIMTLLGLSDIGNKTYVHEYLSQQKLDDVFAQQVFELALDTIRQKLLEMIEEINLKPVYTVADLTDHNIFAPSRIIGVGGAASAIVPHLASKMSLGYFVPEFAPIANALGAALARPTLIASIQVNTLAGYYTLSQEPLRHTANADFNKNTAQTILLQHMHRLALSSSLCLHEPDIEIVEYEEYPVLSGYSDSGIVINMTMQIKPDIIHNTLQ